MAVEMLRKICPDMVHVGYFDTAFHAHHTALYQYYPVPDLWFKQGVLRYGFHGLAYEWVAQELRQQNQIEQRVVAAHLGSGASVCAMHNGCSVDTTMGMTALGGLMMGTRCGDIDPGVLLYMLEHLSKEELQHMMYNESGLKGLAGSGDVKFLLDHPTPVSQLALDLFMLTTAQQIARMAVSLGGLDLLVWSGGVGENATSIRDGILKYLAFMGKITSCVVNVQEERMLAQHSYAWWKENQS